MKEFGRKYGRLPAHHSEMMSVLQVRPHRMRPQSERLLPTQSGIEVWLDPARNQVRVTEQEVSGRRMERLFSVTFDPKAGALRSSGELLRAGDSRLSTENYQLFLVSPVE